MVVELMGPDPNEDGNEEGIFLDEQSPCCGRWVFRMVGGQNILGPRRASR